MPQSSYFKVGRWTLAEERQLLALFTGDENVPADDRAIRNFARLLRRSESSVLKKLGELGLPAPQPKVPDRAQQRSLADAARQRGRAAGFRALANATTDQYIAGRLNVLATEHDDRAAEMEAKANG